MKNLTFIFLLFLSVSANAKIRYVSPRGNDANSGNDTSSTGAWATWQKGFAEALAGDTVFFMGGVYYSVGSSEIDPEREGAYGGPVGHSGTPEKPILYSSYPGQWAILDCIQNCDSIERMGQNDIYNCAIFVQHVRNITFKDFEVRNVFQCDSVLSGAITAYYTCYLTFDHVVLHEVGARGYSVESGAWKTFYEDGWIETPSYWDFDIDTIRWINCDIYNVCDTLSVEPGNGGDCFFTSMYPENVYIWEGCRIWNYSDDGWNADGGGGGKRIIKNCWAMPGDKYKYIGGGWETERNGYKLGWNKISGNDLLWPKPTLHNTLEVSNSLAMFAQQGFREGPSNIGYYYNNTAYKCAIGFDSEGTCTPEYPRPSYKNNLAYKMTQNCAYGWEYYAYLVGDPYDESHNTWDYNSEYGINFVITDSVKVTDDDFIGLQGDDRADSLYLVSLFLAPRQADGSLPTPKPLTLAPTSDLIDAGTRLVSVGTQNEDLILTTVDYEGYAPDIGYAEYTTGHTTPAEPVYVSSVIENATPGKLEVSFSLYLANIVPATSAFTVKVNSTVRNVTSVAISGNKVSLTLATPVVVGNTVTVAYTKPPSNPLQTPEDGQVASFSDKSVINNCSPVINQPPTISISSPTKNASFTAPATITIDAVASDPDGIISKVEFYNLNSKLGECSSSPYSFVWKNVSEGTYVLTAVATDNLNAKATSEPIIVTVEKSSSTVNQLPEVSIKHPSKGGKFKKNEKIVLEAEATDPDGEIIKVEFKNGTTTIAEILTAPYVYIMENADTGKYVITAVATDNLGATSQSSETEFIIFDPYLHDPNLIRLYPNPNDGHFTLDLSGYESEFGPDRVRIINMSGKTIINDILTDQQVLREFNLTNISPGAYIMMLSRDNRVVSTGKFVIK